jgi:hypothetical protein
MSSTWLGESQLSPKSWTTWHSRRRHYVLPKRHKPLSVDIALYPRRLESSSTMLCVQSRKRTWTTWLWRGRNLVLPICQEPLWFDKTLHPSRLTLLCDRLKTTVADVKEFDYTSEVCCAVRTAGIQQLTVFWYVTPWNFVGRYQLLKNPAASISHYQFHYNIVRNAVIEQNHQHVGKKSPPWLEL